MSEYIEQAEKFLTDHNLTFRAIYIGEDCPAFCEDAAKGNILEPGTFPRKNHIHGSHWRMTISGEKRGHITVDFWDSYVDAEEREALKTGNSPGWITDEDRYLMDKYPKASYVTPAAYDMLTCITKSEPGTFEDFCGDFEYDSDSRRAETVYQAVVKEWRMVSRFFTAEELAEIQEIASDRLRP